MKSPVKLPIKYKTKGPSVLPKIPLGRIVVCTELERETIAVTVNPEGPTDTNYRFLVEVETIITLMTYHSRSCCLLGEFLGH